MSDEITQNEQQQMINRLMRSGDGLNENAFVTSAGGKIAGFVARVISLNEYNHYNVRAVQINPSGIEPTIVGNEVVAVNVAEDFMQDGTLAAGTIVIMFKLGEYYCFYAKA
ncbi:MAG: hypothetical protein A2Y12_10790 [Planctomycetes bacterium GWF2_42_9]|nr:MAG: hypothetical protein A2Y12_10790 [Planctomycetes bacterium GWF2_42_9]